MAAYTIVDVDRYETFIGRLANRRDCIGIPNAVILGELLEWAGYDPEQLDAYLSESACEDDPVFVGLTDPNVEVWDGGLTWNREKRIFEYEGADGPSGGSGKYVSVPVSHHAKFEVF